MMVAYDQISGLRFLFFRVWGEEQGIKFMVKKNKIKKHWERRYEEEEIETFESH